MFSFKTGSKHSMGAADGRICEFGRSVDGYCVKTTYVKKNDLKFIEFNSRDDCEYKLLGTKDGDEITFKDYCDCGYNTEGKAYCPLAHTAGIL